VKSRPAQAHRAFLLRASPHGDADVVVTLLTEQHGVVAAIGKSARRPSAKKSWVLEPFHSLSVELVVGRGELWTLRSASLATARLGLLADVERLELAGRAMRWARELLPRQEPEPLVFEAMERMLDRLDGERALDPRGPVLAFGLMLLEALGYGLSLDACARCASPRPPGRRAYLDPLAGGVLCDRCRSGLERTDAPFSGALLDGLAVALEATIDGATGAERAALLAVVSASCDARARTLGNGERR
jgi:DNA repair protein RecO (recombination protein O)